MIDSNRLVSVGMILDELTSCGEDYLKYIVVVFGQDSEDCGIFGLQQYENGLLRLEINWMGWFDCGGDCYSVEELIHDLSSFDRDVKVYLDSPWAIFTFDNHHCIFSEPNEDREYIAADAITLEEKKESPEEDISIIDVITNGMKEEVI